MFRKTTLHKTRVTTWLNQAVRAGSSLPIRFSRVTRLFRKSHVLCNEKCLVLWRRWQDAERRADEYEDECRKLRETHGP
jgi:hypothetical protein